MELSVEGYKSIASKKTIDFEGLTILSGANSSGKSSFMQPFLILKQTIENHYNSGTLELFGENAKLTDASQIISKVSDYRKQSFSVGMKENTRSCRVTYKYNDGIGLQAESTTLINEDIPNGLTLKIGMVPEDIERNLPNDDLIKSLTSLYKEKEIKTSWKAVRNKCFIDAELTLGESNFAPFKAGVEPAANIENFVTNLIHVPGVRGIPERHYKIASSEGSFPGSFEKYVAALISEWSKVESKKYKYLALKKQLLELGLASNISTKKLDDTSLEIQISRSKLCKDDFVNIADVGFGVSQTIPVLVALLSAKNDQHVYIEQPELHLHPKAQYKLAAIISDAIKRGVKVIIETHSSILIRGIQTAVVKGSIDREKVSLNWFSQDPETGKSEVKKSSLDEFGAFGDWPEDFDETYLNAEKEYLDAVEVKAYE